MPGSHHIAAKLSNDENQYTGLSVVSIWSTMYFDQIKRLHGLGLPALVLFVGLLFSAFVIADSKPRIAVFAGPDATILSHPPLVTSNKARIMHDLPLYRNSDGAVPAFDHLIPQRLAAEVEIYVEAYSAHPLESDAIDLYAPPDGYVDAAGRFRLEREGSDDKPVYRVVLKPDDGLYLLPYMARQANDEPWDGDCISPGALAEQCRQPFIPDASRLFEEIDRGLAGLNENGIANPLSSRADFDFYRIVPSGGYKQGLQETLRSDSGKGEIQPEIAGEDYFFYRPPHLRTSPRYQDLAVIANLVQKTLASGDYRGALWFEGSPTIEDTVYWMNLLIDTNIPIIGVAAHRTNYTISADGPGNIVSAVRYIVSDIWRGPTGDNELGVVMIQDEQIIAARQVQKSDARPGGFIATGDHGGILGTMGLPGEAQIYFTPNTRHTWKSEVRLTALPQVVPGVSFREGSYVLTDVSIKGDNGLLLEKNIPRVTIVKAGYFNQESSRVDPDSEVDILARIEGNLKHNLLAGFVAEGLAPYGAMSRSTESALRIAVFSGMPVVFTGRGNAGGVTPTHYHSSFPAIAGNNLTATKARMLLMACLMKFGSIPPAHDPRNPTAAEHRAASAVLAKYQKVFDAH